MRIAESDRVPDAIGYQMQVVSLAYTSSVIVQPLRQVRKKHARVRTNTLSFRVRRLQVRCEPPVRDILRVFQVYAAKVSGPAKRSFPVASHVGV